MAMNSSEVALSVVAEGAPIATDKDSRDTDMSGQSPRLPQEMLDSIVDAFWANRAMLKLLSTTARCFTHRAQSHLHHTIRAHSAQSVANHTQRYGTPTPTSTRLASYVRVLIVGPPDPILEDADNDKSPGTRREAAGPVPFERAEDVHWLVRCFPQLQALDLLCSINSVPKHLQDIHSATNLRHLRALRLGARFCYSRDTTLEDLHAAEIAFHDEILRTADLADAHTLSLRPYHTTCMNAILKRCGARLQHLILTCELPREFTGPIDTLSIRHNTALRSIHVKLRCTCHMYTHTLGLQLSALARTLSTLPAAAIATLREVHVTLYIPYTSLEPHIKEEALRELVESLPLRLPESPPDALVDGHVRFVVRLHVDTFEASRFRPDDHTARQQLAFETSWVKMMDNVRAKCPEIRTGVELPYKSLEYMKMDYKRGPDIFRELAGLIEVEEELPWYLLPWEEETEEAVGGSESDTDEEAGEDMDEAADDKMDSD